MTTPTQPPKPSMIRAKDLRAGDVLHDGTARVLDVSTPHLGGAMVVLARTQMPGSLAPTKHAFLPYSLISVVREAKP